VRPGQALDGERVVHGDVEWPALERHRSGRSWCT
jgi:hypothetical protein